IETEFAKLTDKERSSVINALYNLYSNNQSIVYCASEALGKVLNQIGAGMLAIIALGLIIADAIAGLFVENNKDLIADTSNQLYISAQAMQTVLAKYGKDYKGYTATIDDIVKGLGLEESIVVHVGANHFITVIKNEDGTFTLFDINRSDKKVNLGSQEELNVLLSIYLQGNISTTVLAKPNSIFTDNKLKSDLSKVIGATTYTPNDLITDTQKASDFYLENGDKSYLAFMKLMFSGLTSSTQLTHGQSLAFAQAYKTFLEKALEGLCKKASGSKTVMDLQSDIEALNDKLEKEKDGSKKNAIRESIAQKETALAKARQDQQKVLSLIEEVVYEKTIIEKVNEILNDPKYNLEGREEPILSGQLGQVLIPGISFDMPESDDIPEGTYYLVMSITASHVGTKNYEYGNGKGTETNRDIPEYRVYDTDIGRSLSTMEGGAITLADGSTYKVFGIAGKLEDQSIIFEYFGYYRESTKEFFISQSASVYLANSSASLYQEKQDPTASPPQSGKYGSAAPKRNNWSRGIITEDDNGYTISGAGSRVTIRRDSYKNWKPVIVGMGTDALAGSKLKLGSKNESGQDNNVYINIIAGKMTYTGVYWAVSDGMSWSFNSSTTQEEANVYLTNVLRNQLSAGENKDFVGSVKLKSGNVDKSKTFYGMPFSALDIMHECGGIKFSAELKSGFVYDATSKGDIFKTTLKENTIVTITEKENMLNYLATSDVAVSIELSQSWKYGDNATSKEGIISAGKEISLESFLLNFSNFDLPSILDWLAMNKYGKKYDELGQNFGIDLSIFSSWGLSREQREIQLLVSSSQSAYTAAMIGFLREKGLYVVNTENMEMVSGYEDRVDENGNKILDIDGNPRLDFDKPITSTIGIGKLQISVDFFGNTKGYVLFDNVRIKFTNTGWLVDNDGSSGHYWQRGAQVSVTGTKDDDGKITYKASITKGNLYVSDLDNVHIPKPDNGGNNNDKPPYDGPTFNGSVTRHSNDGSGGHYFSGITGTFFGISGINLTRDGLGDYLYAPGSNFSAHSYAPDGTKSKYRFYMKDDGTIQQIGVPWYAKLWGWVKAIAKIVVTFIVAVILVVVASFLIAVLAALFSVFQDFFLNLAKDWFASIYDDWNRTEDSDHTTETAWKGGMAMLAAGVMAIITAVIALASIVSAAFTGGATLAVGIAAVIGMISAIAGVVQVAQMTYQAVLCIAYGNIGAGLAMLAIALVLAIVTMVGANGVGNAISAGLQSVAFVLKAALIGAVIGSAIGAGVGALGGYIANGISTGEWSGDGAANAAANGAISGAIAGAFAGASIGISIASTIAKQAAKTAAETAAETIGESVGEATGRAVGVSFSQGMSFLGQSIKGFLTSVNFVAVEGIKSVVVNIGKAVAHVLKIALKLASMALDMYVTYKSAESMFDAIEKMVKGEEGALEQFLSALWTLISINLIAPFMSGQQGIQSKEDIEAAAKAEVDAAQLEKLVQTPKDAINKLEIVKGELSSIFVGWSTWGSHILTGAIGAGLGVGAVYLIAWLNNETLDGIDWKDIVIGASIGFGVGMAASMFSRLFGNINIGTKIVDSIKKTLGQLTGYSESSGIRSLANFAKVWGSGLVGSVIGALLVPLIAWLSSDDNEDNDDNNYLTLALIGAGVGLVIGLGFGGAWINGKFENLGGRLKETIFGKLSDSESGQLPLIVRFESPIAANALKMSINMSIMNTRLAFASAIGQKFLIKIGLGDIVTDPDGALVIIDKVTGMGLLEKGTSLNDSNFSKEAINDVFLQSFEQMTNPQMIVFSSIVQVLQPILTPALLSSPGLGTIMDPIVAVGESGFMKNEAMSYLYENGIKERLAGVVGKLIFGDSMAGEIFQELFDEMPDDIGKTKMEQLEFLASHGLDADNVIEATRILKSDPLKFKENMIETFNIIGINMPAAEIDIVLNRFYESCGISLKDIENVTALQKTLKDTQIEIRKEGISKEDIAKLKETESKIKKDLNEIKKSLNVTLKTVSTSNLTRFILNEVIIYKIKENNFFKTSGANADGEDEVYAKMIKENVMQVINSSVIPEGLSVNEQINYLYASAGLVSFGINPKSIGQSLTTVEIEEIMKTARENGKQQLAAEYLLNYAANVSKTPGREQEMLAVADILIKMVDDIDAQNITAKTLFMTQYLNVLINSMETATEFKNLANLGVRTQGQQQRFEELQVYLDIQNTVDNLFNVVGKHMVETFKNSQGLKDARTIALASLDSRTPEQQKEFDALNLSDGEIEVLKKLYSTQTLALNNYINM
ncbi:MAG: hypothetical protein LBL47_00825, partial [Lactobacillus sp.]|nr:hypothetical protein [Lactobacillus sp.]